MSLAEGIKARPSMYANYLCSKCGKYNLEIERKDLSEEDEKMLCKCGDKNENVIS